jgi:hypothetical protein
MIGSILLGVGCFALGGLVGFFVGMAVVAHSVANNVKGARDLMKKHIAESSLSAAIRHADNMHSAWLTTQPVATR